MRIDSASAALAPLRLAEEDARIAAHLLAAERHCRANAHDAEGATRLLRALLLDELAEYRLDARFPRHHVPRERTPVFVDAYGTRCAVGHLLDVCGEHDLVRRIGNERNLARVSELADEPVLGEWLSYVGISVDEAAGIQPDYTYTESWLICGNCVAAGNTLPSPGSAVLDAHVVASHADGTFSVVVDAVFGTTSAVTLGSQLDVELINVRDPAARTPTRVVIPTSASVLADGGGGGLWQPAKALAVSSGGAVSCSSSSPDLDVATYASSVATGDCYNTVLAIGAQWQRTVDVDSSGCSLSHAPSPSVDILLAAVPALVALAIARRRSRRR